MTGNGKTIHWWCQSIIRNPSELRNFLESHQSSLKRKSSFICMWSSCSNLVARVDPGLIWSPSCSVSSVSRLENLDRRVRTTLSHAAMMLLISGVVEGSLSASSHNALSWCAPKVVKALILSSAKVCYYVVTVVTAGQWMKVVKVAMNSWKSKQGWVCFSVCWISQYGDGEEIETLLKNYLAQIIANEGFWA